MLRKLSCAVIWWLIVCTSTQAQITVSGYIRNADSMPLVHASILLHNLSLPEKPLVGFTNSDNNGYYSLSLEDTTVSYLLTVKAFSHVTVERRLLIPHKSSSIQQNFLLHSSVSYLDTVKVDIKIAVSQTGDTITFNPDAFALKNETTVQDLLSRLPGMDIKEDGKIYFNGKFVSRVLIDGDDVFKTNYELLTQNAAPKIVDRVQVFKNYQKDQLLKEFNQHGGQVINLKLKDAYKNYLFGHAAAGYGNDQNKVADMFLVRLSTRNKIQAGVNYNTTGSVYIENQVSRPQSDPSFFSYRPANNLLNVARHKVFNLPAYYQDRNESVQAHANALFKTNNFESTVNARYAMDELRDDQYTRQIYADGTVLNTGNMGRMRSASHEYAYSGTKTTKKQSLFINASLRSRRRNYDLQTVSSQSLQAAQKLIGDNRDWQLNLSYYRKLREGILWTTTVGYFDQSTDEQLLTEPDLLFWLFPYDHSLAKLRSGADISLRYLKFKSGLLINRKRMNHEINAHFLSQYRIFKSALITQDLNDHASDIPFQNNSLYSDPAILVQYKGSLRLSKTNRLVIGLANEPHFFRYRLTTDLQTRNRFFYDYSITLSGKKRSSVISATAGVSRKPGDSERFFQDFVQTGFHTLQSGHPDLCGKASTYLHASYNLFSIKLGWIAFAMLHVSRDRQDFIRSLETKGIGTVQSFFYHPAATNQMMALLNSQKTLGDWPLSLQVEAIYSRQGSFDRFNGVITASDLQFINPKIGLKTQFKGILNFDESLSLLHARSLIRTPNSAIQNATSFMNKLNVFITSQEWLRATITLNSMVSNRGAFEGHFLDIKANKKILQDRLLLEIDCRNLLNKKFAESNSQSSLSQQQNRNEIRGTTLYLTVRYEFR